MAASNDQEDAARQRIIRHMNADHQDSVRRYLEAYGQKSLLQTRDAKMTYFNLTEMRLSCSGQSTTIAFDPPMKSLREARERLVQLDKDALQALGRDDIPITSYVPPYVKLGHLYNFTQCLLCYIFLPWPSNFKPGSLLYDNLLFMVPSFASFVAGICRLVFIIMLPIHLAEAALMAKKLSKHGLTPLDKVWWLWTGSCFVEGFTSFWRLNSWIDGKRREKAEKKH